MGISPCAGDASDESFAIDTFRVVTPNGGERWQLGSVHKVSWLPEPDSRSIIAYLDQLVDGKFVTVGQILEAARGSIYWLGDVGTLGNYPKPGFYYVRVVNNETGEIDRSDKPFEIVPFGTVKVDMKINGVDGPLQLGGGGNVQLSWTSSNADRCALNSAGYNGHFEIGIDYIAGLPPTGTLSSVVSSSFEVTAYGIGCSSDVGDANDQALAVIEDRTPPWPPKNLQAEAISPTKVRLSWIGSQDFLNLNRIAYRIYRNGTYTASTLLTSYTDGQTTPLTPDTKYSYTVAAYDSSPARNMSAQSEPVSVTTPPLPIPIVPPSITSISPSVGNPGDWITIYGANFSPIASQNIVSLIGPTGQIGVASVTSTKTTLDFRVPTLKPGNYEVRVSVPNIGASEPYRYFQVITGTSTQPYILMTTLNTSEGWTPGSNHAIAWTSAGINTVTLELMNRGVFDRTIVSNYPNTNRYTWTVPSDLPSGGIYTIRVKDTNTPSLYDDTTSYFYIPIDTTTLQCTPRTQTITVGTKATLTFTGGNRIYDVVAPGAFPVALRLIGGGSVASFTYIIPSTTPYVITVTSDTKKTTCEVVVR